MPTISLSESMDKDGMRQLIRNERIVELAGEGYHYSDMRRWYRKDPGFDISTLSHDVNEFTGKKWRLVNLQKESSYLQFLNQN